MTKASTRIQKDSQDLDDSLRASDKIGNVDRSICMTTSPIGRTTKQPPDHPIIMPRLDEDEEKFKELARYIKMSQLPIDMPIQPALKDQTDELVLPEIFCQVQGTTLTTTWWDFRSPETINLEELDDMLKGY